MIIKFCENLLSKIRERQGVCADRLLVGSFNDFVEYKNCTGKLQGLKEAEDIVKRIYKDMFDTKVLRNDGKQEDIEYE
jgi:hypothetical protein